MAKISLIFVTFSALLFGQAEIPRKDPIALQVALAQNLGSKLHDLIVEPTPAAFNAIQEDIYKEAMVPLGLAILRHGAQLFPEDEQIKANLKKFEDRIIYLKERYDFFHQAFKDTKKDEHVGSMAVIQYHLGQKRESLLFLGQYVEKRRNRNLMALMSNLVQEARLQVDAAQVLRTQFDDKVISKEKDGLLLLACQWYVLNCYEEMGMSIFDGMAYDGFITKDFLKEIEFLGNTKYIARQIVFVGSLNVD